MSVIGWMTVAAFGWLAIFQTALAAGAPIGALAWGGAYRRLPRALRLASAAVIPLALLGLVTTGQALGAWAVVPPRAVQPILWAFAALFGLSFIGNLASSSGAERLHGVPLTVLLTLGCTLLALAE